MANLNLRRTITFRQVLIVLTIICFANLCTNLFIGASNKAQTVEAKSTAVEKSEHKCVDPDHTSCDGLCECDGNECDASELDEAIKDIVLTHGQDIMNRFGTSLGYDDKMRENMRAYQIEINDNGNKMVLYDGNKPVHVFDRAFPGNANLFHVLDRDNW